MVLWCPDALMSFIVKRTSTTLIHFMHRARAYWIGPCRIALIMFVSRRSVHWDVIVPYLGKRLCTESCCSAGSVSGFSETT